MRSNHRLFASAAILWLAAACNNTTTPGSPVNSPGTVLPNPGAGVLSPVIVEQNAAGRAPELKLVRALYGRLVDVYAFNSAGNQVPIVQEVVIRASLVADFDNYRLATDPVTGQENLLIPRNIETATGREGFNSLLKAATEGLDTIFDGGFGQAGFYSMVPRNAAVTLIFDDLLDPSTINGNNIETFTGPAPFSPFSARVLPDPIYGDVQDFDGDGTAEFYTNRAIVDFTTSSFESFQTSPPLPINPEGMPPSVDQNLDNFQIRIPTMISGIYGQTTLLANLTDHTMRVFSNGSADLSSPTQDIVRAFRSGGRTEVTGDDFNGFLRDESAPNIVAALPAAITIAPVQVNPVNDPDLFQVPAFVFDSPDCSQTPEVGDFFFQSQLQGAVWGRVEQLGNDPDGVGAVTDTVVRVLSYPPVWDDTAGVALWTVEGVAPFQFLSAYNPAADAGRERCFLETFPLSDDYPANPASGIPSTATWGLRFSEPMDLTSFSAYDGLRLTRVDPTVGTLAPSEYAITEVSASTDRTRFFLTPAFPLTYDPGSPLDSYFLSIVRDGDFAPTDLAGNVIRYDFAPIEGTLSSFSPDISNGTNVSLFNTQDEQAPVANLNADVDPDPFVYAEWGGQHIFLPLRGVITPRPVSRFTQVIDRNTAYSGHMGQFAGGVLEPLVRFGNKTQMLWRIYDMDMPLFDVDLTDANQQDQPWNLDIARLNIDVERVYWSPLTGGITFDRFNGFSMRLSHSIFLPDELHSVPQNSVSLPGTGVGLTYSQNQLSVTADVPVVTHFREQGYTLDPGDRIVINNTVLMPFPMNMDPTRPKRFYTWRDTAKISRGGPNGIGANIAQWAAANGVTGPTALFFPFEDDPCDGTGGPTNFYAPGEVQTSALPLMIEFRCYPDTAAGTANLLDVSDTQLTTQVNPFFRAFSSGGVNVNQEPQFVDPDTETTASGGFDPTSSPTPGVPTPGTDKRLYIGAVDFVVRVSRSYSIWFPTPDAAGNPINNPLFYEPIVEPKPADQPPGTSINFAFRGAGAILGAWEVGQPVDPTGAGFQMSAAAQLLDPYGDHYPNTPICANPPDDSVNPPIPAGPNFPFLVVEHNSVDANQPADGLIGGGDWFANASQINGAQFYQVRATFVSNPDTNQSPVLSTFAMGWQD